MSAASAEDFEGCAIVGALRAYTDIALDLGSYYRPRHAGDTERAVGPRGCGPGRRSSSARRWSGPRGGSRHRAIAEIGPERGAELGQVVVVKLASRPRKSSKANRHPGTAGGLSRRRLGRDRRLGLAGSAKDPPQAARKKPRLPRPTSSSPPAVGRTPRTGSMSWRECSDDEVAGANSRLSPKARHRLR